MKKCGILLLAAILILSLAIPAVAAETYTITIQTSALGHTYEAYQIFTGTLSEGTLTNLQWGDGVDSDGLVSCLTNDPELKARFSVLPQSPTADEVVEAMEGMQDHSDEAQALAQAVGQYLNAEQFKTSHWDENYIISNLAAGYYLVKDKDGTQGEEVEGGTYTRFIVAVVGNVTATPKTGTVTVEKKVCENTKYTQDAGYGIGYNDVADYCIGDTVPFALIGALPENYEDYAAYAYEFHDEIAAGLTFQKDARVYVGNTELTDFFTIEYSGQTMTVSCEDLKSIAALDQNSKIVVKYSALFNQNAVIGLDGNLNEAYLCYSNNPNLNQESSMGKTPTDRAIVFTYQLDAANIDGTDRTKLPGAAFWLYKLVDGTPLYAMVTNGRVSGWTAEQSKAATLTSAAETGLFQIAGLDDGAYYLQEIKAPDGYNLRTAPIPLTVRAATANGQDWSGGWAQNALTGLTLTTGNVTSTGDTGTGVVTVQVESSKTMTLPATGGGGTRVFYTAGVILVAGAVVLLLVRKRGAGKG